MDETIQILFSVYKIPVYSPIAAFQLKTGYWFSKTCDWKKLEVEVWMFQASPSMGLTGQRFLWKTKVPNIPILAAADLVINTFVPNVPFP